MATTVMTLKRLEDFTPEVALHVLKKHLTESNPYYNSISIDNLTLVKKGIQDENTIKYVYDWGASLFQIVAIDYGKSQNENKKVSVYIGLSNI